MKPQKIPPSSVHKGEDPKENAENTSLMCEVMTH